MGLVLILGGKASFFALHPAGSGVRRVQAAAAECRCLQRDPPYSTVVVENDGLRVNGHLPLPCRVAI